MNSNLIMFLFAAFALLVGGLAGGLGINYLAKRGKDPKSILATANTVISEAKTANDTFGKLLPAPVESIVDLVIKAAQAGVHAAQQLCNSDQLTQDERNQKAFDTTMNLLKVGGYEPTPELQAAVKDMIETGVFIMKNIDKPSVVKADAPVLADSSLSIPDPVSVVAVADPKPITEVIQQTIDQVGEQAKTQAVHDLTSKFAAVVQEATQPVQSIPDVIQQSA